jgi:hypothetical protein
MKNKFLYLFIIFLLFTSCNNQSIEEEKVNYKKISFYEGYYDAFGTLIDDDKNLYYYTRRGSAHVGDVATSIIQMQIDKNFEQNIKIKEIYKDFNNSIDVRNIGGGKINYNHYLFLSKYSPNSFNKWVGFGYIKYNIKDNSTRYIEIGLNGYDAINPHGHIIKVEDIYYQPIYAQKDGLYYVIFLKSLDNGNSWIFGNIVYQGLVYYNETSGEYMDNGVIKLVTRKDVRNGMVQFTSTDYGESWSEPLSISIESNNTNVPYTVKSNNKMYLIYTDRNDSKLKISYLNKKNKFLKPRTLAIAENNNTWFVGYSPIIYDDNYFYTIYADHQGDYKSTKTYFLKFNKKYLNFDK